MDCDTIAPMKREINPRLLRSEPIRRCCLDECRAACCLYGVWLDQAEWNDIRENAALIIPHMPSGWDDPDCWLDGREEADEFVPTGRVVHSRVLPDPDHYGGSACVFLREDHKCALQVAGQTAGMHPWRFKPFYCVLHPLDLDEQGRITLDETEALLTEPGSCLRPAGGTIPLLKTFEPELRYLLGDEQYQFLAAGIANLTQP
jgi:hypothetical protein